MTVSMASVYVFFSATWTAGNHQALKIV